MKKLVWVILCLICNLIATSANSAAGDADSLRGAGKMRLIVFDIHHQFMVVETDETETLREFKSAIKKKISEWFPRKDLRSLRISLTRGGRTFRECDDKSLKELEIKPVLVPSPDKNLIISLSAPGIGSVYNIEKQFPEYKPSKYRLMGLGPVRNLPICWAILGLLSYPN